MNTANGLTSWKRRTLPLVALMGGVTCALVLAAVWPRAHGAAALLLAQDDPAALADARLDAAPLDAAAYGREIDAALAANDPGLAASFRDLAAARRVDLPTDVTDRVAAAVAEQGTTSHLARQFGRGLVTGETSDLASLSGTVTGDLLVIGDIRDVAHEGARMVRGEEPDRLVLGLAAAGIAVTAATYVSLGGAAPVRAGLTLVKDARRAGRLGTDLAVWTERAARDVVDAGELEQAAASAASLRPVAAMDSVRAAIRVDKAGELLRATKDVGRVGERAGVRGALDTLRVAEGPEDLARAARLSAGKTSQTRAILKLFGRGALLLASGAFDLALWLFGAAITVFGLLCSIKRMAESVGSAWSRRARVRRAARRQTGGAAMPLAQVAVPAQTG